MSRTERYIAPKSLPEALRVLGDGDVTVLCGGTDLSPQTASGQRRYGATLMNIRRIDGLGVIDAAGDEIHVGALATITDIRESALLRAAAPVLTEAASHFASDQIRNAASIGGNLCNASPAGDMSVPLLVLDAAVQLARWRRGGVETRLVPVHAFFTGPGRTVKEDDELLTAIVLPRPAANFTAAFRKSGPRPALEIAKVSAAIGGHRSGGVMRGARVAFGAAAPTPRRAPSVEAALEGNPLDEDSIRTAVAAVAADAAPIDDVRASAWYRLRLLEAYTEEILDHVRRQGLH
jgi:CO/xanthine dehydrogenase FAD-binding subunit